jgi:excisionase family DNA binding protein
MTTIEKRWLSKDEAAEYLGISLMSLRRLMEPDSQKGERQLHAHKPVPGRTMLDRNELDTYMESRRAESGTQR